MLSGKLDVKNSKFTKNVWPIINFFANFLQYCLQRAEIAQIAQVNQLFQLLNLVRIEGHGFCELSSMQMSKHVNNDVSKDSPTCFNLDAHITD